MDPAGAGEVAGMDRSRGVPGIWVFVLLALGTSPACAQRLETGCPEGVACYCNQVHDPELLFCEDWEAPQLHDDVKLGDPEGGPWYDGTGARGFRGYGSYFTRRFG